MKIDLTLSSTSLSMRSYGTTIEVDIDDADSDEILDEFDASTVVEHFDTNDILNQIDDNAIIEYLNDRGYELKK